MDIVRVISVGVIESFVTFNAFLLRRLTFLGVKQLRNRVPRERVQTAGAEVTLQCVWAVTIITYLPVGLSNGRCRRNYGEVVGLSTLYFVRIVGAKETGWQLRNCLKPRTNGS